MTTVVAVVQCKKWGDNTRKLRIPFPRDHPGELSYTGDELQSAILAKIRDILGHPPSSGDDSMNNDTKEGGEWVEIYDNERKCFVSLRNDGARRGNVAPKFGRLVRCIAHLHSGSTSSTTDQSRSDHVQQQRTPPLAIMGRYFHYDPNGMDYCGRKLAIREKSNDLHEDGTGLNIWDGALLLAKYMELHVDVVKGRRVLELGSGPGFVGIAAGLAGASEVVLTDLQYCMPLMKENALRNMDAAKASGCQRIECRVLDWYDPPTDISQLGFASDQAPDVILIADCVWLEELVAPLILTMQQILRLCAPKPPQVIISYQRRGKGAHDAFMSGLQDTFGTIAESGDEAHLTKPDVMHIFECNK